MNACVVSIGNELLIGETVNTNAAWIGRRLGETGIVLQKIITIGDDGNAIVSAVDEAVGHYAVTIVTGGLGPTHDDITKNVITDYFGGKLVFHPEILARLKAYFEARGYPFPKTNESQAYLPDNAEILPNKAGSAQGMLFKKNGHLCFVLPGVPREMEYIMENSVLPYLRQLKNDQVVQHFTWRTTGVPESLLAEMLGDVSRIEEHGRLAFLPKYTGVDLRLTVEAKSVEEAETHRKQVEKLITEKIGNYVYATGDMPLEKVIGDLLREKRQTLAVAESCTGGLICSRLTRIPGSSAYFMGGMVTYSNEQKVKALGVSAATLARHGAVSEETAREMAAGVRRAVGTDYGLSVTGIAGPEGGTPEKPVGLVYIGLATKNQVEARRHLFARDRQINQERSATAALLWLWRVLKEQV